MLSSWRPEHPDCYMMTSMLGDQTLVCNTCDPKTGRSLTYKWLTSYSGSILVPALGLGQWEVSAHVESHEESAKKKQMYAAQTHTQIGHMLAALVCLLEGACEVNYPHTKEFARLHLLSLESCFSASNNWDFSIKVLLLRRSPLYSRT